MEKLGVGWTAREKGGETKNRWMKYFSLWKCCGSQHCFLGIFVTISFSSSDRFSCLYSCCSQSCTCLSCLIYVVCERDEHFIAIYSPGTKILGFRDIMSDTILSIILHVTWSCISVLACSNPNSINGNKT